MELARCAGNTGSGGVLVIGVFTALLCAAVCCMLYSTVCMVWCNGARCMVYGVWCNCMLASGPVCQYCMYGVRTLCLVYCAQSQASLLYFLVTFWRLLCLTHLFWYVIIFRSPSQLKSGLVSCLLCNPATVGYGRWGVRCPIYRSP